MRLIPEYIFREFDHKHAYLMWGPSRDFKKARLEAKWIIRRLGLKKGNRILDLGCGNGRHTRIFAQRGLETTGVDCSGQQIRLARTQTRADQIKNVKYVCYDMRKFKNSLPYDAVTMLGYSNIGLGGKREHIVFFKHVYSLLSESGYFVFDIQQHSLIKRRCRIRYDFKKRGKDGYFFIDRRYDSGRRIYSGTVVAFANEVAISSRRRWRIFSASEIISMVRRSGFSVVGKYGDLSGGRFLNQKTPLTLVVRK